MRIDRIKAPEMPNPGPNSRQNKCKFLKVFEGDGEQCLNVKQVIGSRERKKKAALNVRPVDLDRS
jgi:hypothetical protein